MKKISSILFLLIVMNFTAVFASIEVGIARKSITPKDPIWLTGYAVRETPATGVAHDLWAKAMVIADGSKIQAIIVTTDVLGLSREISTDVANEIIRIYGITRSQLLLNSSHTHSGPMIWPALSGIANYEPKDQQVVSNYSQQLTKDLITVIGMAKENLEPATLSSGNAIADFAINRRRAVAGVTTAEPNPKSPIDHDVPVVKVTAANGKIKAILFGYACHNTTVQADNYLVNGDYAGFAQLELEKANPGATAMFVLGCAGDQNPAPRGTIALAEQHGKSLATAVLNELSSGDLRILSSPIRTAYVQTELEFAPFKLANYQKDIIGTDKFLQRRAKLMLEAYNKGWDVSKLSYPVQAISFGKNFTILALAGEVVVDYSLMTKKNYPNQNVFVAGYSNEVMCYIPTKRILAEGGYEPISSMIYYSMPGPFKNDVEERILLAIDQVMKKVGAKKNKSSK
jgi:neutral ceramidase